MLPRRPIFFLLAAVAACAALYVAHLRSKHLFPAYAPLAAETTGSFTAGGGWHPGEPLAHAAPHLRAWGSWSGNDANTGTLALGPFPAPRLLHFGVSGYPSNPGNSLHVERADTRERLEIKYHPVGERWFVCDFELPRAWVGRPIRLVAADNATDLGGWIALTEPLHGGRGDANNALLETYTAFACNALFLGLLYFAAARILASTTLPPHWLPLLAGAAVAAAGYLVYWSYFAHPWLGRAVTALLFLWAIILLFRASALPRFPDSSEFPRVLALTATIGAFHLAILHLFPTGHDFYTLTANRFRDGMPGDNMLSHMYAERLFAGEAPKNSADEWQSSDRPPLQIGWQLLTWPASKLLNLDRKSFSGTSAVWFQLLWVSALYGFLRAFELTPRRAAAWTAVCALSGFFLQNTTFTWPKLSAAAFTVAAYALLFLRQERRPGAPPSHLQPSTFNFQLAASAALAALAWLSHGGVAFSFLPLVPVVLWRLLRDTRARQLRPWLLAAAVFAAFALPWIAYQKFYDPPGNLLLKYHFADTQKQDSRSVLQTIRDAYAKIGWRKAWQHKVDNFHGQVFGDYRHLVDISAATKADRRNQEFFHIGRGLTWWPLLVPFALVLTRRRFLSSSPATADPAPPVLTADLLALAAWLAATIVIWCLLMFAPYTAAIHQGSYAVMLGLFALCSVLLDRSGRFWLLLLALLQTVTLAANWTVSNPAIHGPSVAFPIVLLTAAPLVFFILLGLFRERDAPVQPERSPAPTPASPRLGISARPRLAFLLLAAAFALVLFLRKPHAFHTPQLWAEDGSIFLIEADTLGLKSFVTPYAGYLHTLPRLIAWLASVLLDPAWWPAFYNGAAILIWLAAMCRFFSPRLAIPAKLLVALALVCVPHPGEVFFNVTNLQWVTAFVLIQQAIIAPPRNRGEAALDAALVAVLALTGPFGAALIPLFLLRWLLGARRAHPNGFNLRALFTRPNLSALAILLIVVLCAAIQAWFLRTGPRLDYQSAPFQLWPNIVVTARRLLAWPTLGNEPALSLAPWVIGACGGAFLLALLGWCCRPHPLRPLRLQVIAAFFLVLLAGIYRTRPDTWAADNLDFGDRYFYIPRVLLVWLLIWEFTSTPRWIANIARVTCLLMVFVHIRDFTLRAPKDYEWARHVEPLRRGERASIPIHPEGWTLEYPGRPKR